MANITSYFARAGWAAEEIEPAIWRATFASDDEEDFDLYVLVAEDWVHFAVSPVIAVPAEVNSTHIYGVLLHLNQELRLARFAIDGDGDINLVADLPLARISAAVFAQALDLMVYYTGRLARELRRMLADPTYHSPLVT